MATESRLPLIDTNTRGSPLPSTSPVDSERKRYQDYDAKGNDVASSGRPSSSSSTSSVTLPSYAQPTKSSRQRTTDPEINSPRRRSLPNDKTFLTEVQSQDEDSLFAGEVARHRNTRSPSLADQTVQSQDNLEQQFMEKGYLSEEELRAQLAKQQAQNQCPPTAQRRHSLSRHLSSSSLGSIAEDSREDEMARQEALKIARMERRRSIESIRAFQFRLSLQQQLKSEDERIKQEEANKSMSKEEKAKLAETTAEFERRMRQDEQRRKQKIEDANDATKLTAEQKAKALESFKDFASRLDTYMSERAERRKILEESIARKKPTTVDEIRESKSKILSFIERNKEYETQRRKLEEARQEAARKERDLTQSGRERAEVTSAAFLERLDHDNSRRNEAKMKKIEDKLKKEYEEEQERLSKQRKYSKEDKQQIKESMTKFYERQDKALLKKDEYERLRKRREIEEKIRILLCSKRKVGPPPKSSMSYCGSGDKVTENADGFVVLQFSVYNKALRVTEEDAMSQSTKKPLSMIVSRKPGWSPSGPITARSFDEFSNMGMKKTLSWGGVSREGITGTQRMELFIHAWPKNSPTPVWVPLCRSTPLVMGEASPKLVLRLDSRDARFRVRVVWEGGKIIGETAINVRDLSENSGSFDTLLTRAMDNAMTGSGELHCEWNLAKEYPADEIMPTGVEMRTWLPSYFYQDFDEEEAGLRRELAALDHHEYTAKPKMKTRYSLPSLPIGFETNQIKVSVSCVLTVEAVEAIELMRGGAWPKCGCLVRVSTLKRKDWMGWQPEWDSVAQCTLERATDEGMMTWQYQGEKTIMLQVFARPLKQKTHKIVSGLDPRQVATPSEAGLLSDTYKKTTSSVYTRLVGSAIVSLEGVMHLPGDNVWELRGNLGKISDNVMESHDTTVAYVSTSALAGQLLVPLSDPEIIAAQRESAGALDKEVSLDGTNHSSESDSRVR